MTNVKAEAELLRDSFTSPCSEVFDRGCERLKVEICASDLSKRMTPTINTEEPSLLTGQLNPTSSRMSLLLETPLLQTELVRVFTRMFQLLLASQESMVSGIPISIFAYDSIMLQHEYESKDDDNIVSVKVGKVVADSDGIAEGEYYTVPQRCFHYISAELCYCAEGIWVNLVQRAS